MRGFVATFYAHLAFLRPTQGKGSSAIRHTLPHCEIFDRFQLSLGKKDDCRNSDHNAKVPKGVISAHSATHRVKIWLRASIPDRGRTSLLSTAFSMLL